MYIDNVAKTEFSGSLFKNNSIIPLVVRRGGSTSIVNTVFESNYNNEEKVSLKPTICYPLCMAGTCFFSLYCVNISVKCNISSTHNGLITESQLLQ